MPDAIGATVTKPLTEAVLETGHVKLGEREAAELGLPQHSEEVTCRYSGETFQAAWRARDLTLTGDLLHETLMFSARVGNLLRLQSIGSGLELDIVSPSISTLTGGVDSGRPVGPPPAASRASTPRRPVRTERESRFRIRDAAEYDWHGNIGVHRPTVGRFAGKLGAASWDSVDLFDLRLRGDRLATVNDFDELLAVDLANVEHMPHQERTAAKALGVMRGRAILADEVGLGKTIEAGLIMKELVVRGLARRILVICPASLREQWQEELRDKFDETFDVVLSGYSSFDGDRIILSHQLAKLNTTKLTRRPWDLVVVDEAHKLSGKTATKAHELLEALDSRFKLFLTATPVQNDLLELYRLVELLRPGTFRSQREFERRYVDRDNKRLPRDAQALRRLVSDVMIRTTREQAGLDKVTRHAIDVPVKLSRAERHAYTLCTDLLRHVMTGRHDHLRRTHLAQRLTASPRALATTAQKLARSHENPQAAAILAELAELCRDFGLTSRQQALLELVRRWTADKVEHGKVLVFAQAYETVHDLLRILAEHGFDAVGYHGGLTPQQRQKAISRFRGDSPVMVSTDAGAEGLNLQFANCVVNYDLPWNPMRIEQRIGRVHRVTQHRDVYVANLFARGTIDEQVYRLLHDKLRMFELLFGQVTTILGEIGDSKDEGSFERQVLDAYLAPDDEQMNRRLEALGHKVDRAYRSAQEITSSAADISSWLADRSYRDQIVGQATELVPDVELRSDDRQRQVQVFTRDLLRLLDAEISFATDDDSFLMATLPDDAAEAMGGRRHLCLAFSPTGLDHHRDAELCAVGSEVFDDMLLTLQDRGELLVQVPEAPAIDRGPLVLSAADTTFVGRELLGPAGWAAQVQWQVHVGESSLGNQVVTTEMGDLDEFVTPQHRTLNAGEALPETAGAPSEVVDWIVGASVPQLQVRLEELQAEADRHAADESQRLAQSFDNRIDELASRRNRFAFGSTQRTSLEAEVDKLKRARATARQQRAAEVQLRSEPLSVRLAGERTLRFEETWRAALGALGSIEIDWDPWGTEPLRAVGDGGGPVHIVRVCSAAHAVDVDETQACATCDHVSCDECDRGLAPKRCTVCPGIACQSCRDADGLCPACSQPARAPQHDCDGMVAWSLGGDHKLLVGQRIAVLDGDVIDDLHGDVWDLGARVRAEARRRELRADMGVGAAVPEAPIGTGPAAFALTSDLDSDWTVEEAGGSVVSAGVARRLPDAGTDATTPQHSSPLHAVIDRLRAVVPPEPAPRLVLETSRWASWFEMREGDLHVVAYADSGLQPDAMIDATPVVWSPPDGASRGVVASASTGVGRLALRRLHRSYVLDVEGRGSWFIPADDGTDQVVELVARGLADAMGLPPGTAVGLAPVEPLPESVASSDGATCVRMDVDQHWQTSAAGQAPPFSHDDLRLVGSEVAGAYEELPRLAIDGLRRLARSLDTSTVTGAPVAIERAVEVTATWEGRTAVTRRFTARHGGVVRPPLDDIGSEADDFTIDDHGHLCEPTHCWPCPACETWRCRACGDGGALGACAACDQPACGDCRTAEHAARAAATCGLCGTTSCADCGRDIEPARCTLCQRTTCRACRSGALCATCTDLRPATDEEVAALPTSLIAPGLDVRIARDSHLMVVTLSGSMRREPALVEDDEVAAWWTIADVSDPQTRLLLAAGALAGLGDLAITCADATEPAPPDDPSIVTTRTERTAVDWAVYDRSGRHLGGSVQRHDAGGFTERYLLAAVAPSLATVRVPGEVRDRGRRSALLTAIPEAPQGPAGAVRLQPHVGIDETRVTAEGLRRRLGTADDVTERLHDWKPGPGRFAAEIAEWPLAPSATVHASSGSAYAVVARLGPTVLVGTQYADTTSWYRYDPVGQDATTRHDALRLAIALERRQPCDVVRLTLPTDVATFTVTNGVLRQRAVRPHAVDAPGPASTITTTRAAAFWAADVDLLQPEINIAGRVPPELGQKLDIALADGTEASTVALGIAHHDVWEVPAGLVEVSYVVQGGARLGLVRAHDSGTLRPSLTADRSGHLVETTAMCPYCQSLTCARCEAPVGSCWLCATQVCGRCGSTAPDRLACPACASLERIGWRARRRDEVAHAVLRQVDDIHGVAVAAVDGGAAQVVVTGPDEPDDKSHVGLTQAQADYLNDLAKRSLFRPGIV